MAPRSVNPPHPVDVPSRSCEPAGLGHVPSGGDHPYGRGQAPSSSWPWRSLALLAVTFGIVEAVLVTAYRVLLDPEGTVFPLLGLPEGLDRAEQLREVASLLLLASAARLASRRRAGAFAAFLFLFGIWDVVYYATLRGTLGWPQSLTEWDLLFLLPVPWLGPIYAPLLVSLVMITAGALTLRHEARYGAFRLRPGHGVAAACGALACVWSFVENDAARALEALPPRYAVEFLALGLAVGVGAYADAYRRNRIAAGRRDTPRQP